MLLVYLAHSFKFMMTTFKIDPSLLELETPFYNPKPILILVSQGSLSGPRLFSIYENDIPGEPEIVLAIFVDDTAMLHKHKHALQVFSKLQNYLDKISGCLKSGELK